MRNANEMWSPARFVIDGEFATSQDLAGAIRDLAGLTNAPVVVVSYSGKRIVRSISSVHSSEDEWSRLTLERIGKELERGLEDKREKRPHFELAEELAEQVLIEAGCENPITLRFGGDLDRPGRLAVLIATNGPTTEDVSDQADLVASCALGSRAAAFSLDTSLELAILSELRKAAEAARPPDPSQPSNAQFHAVDSLLGYAAGFLGTAVIAAYEADPRNPHRFVDLDRRSIVVSNDEPCPEWIPETVQLTDCKLIPAPPELGGSQFDELGEFVDRCFSSNSKPRRLVGFVGESSRVYGIPYGFDDVRRRAVGVLCLIWPRDDERRLGPYELAASRMIAQQLARSYNTRHSADAVRRVTGQLSYISELPNTDCVRGVKGCEEFLRRRRDIKLIAGPVSEIVRGLVNLSGAMSVTCRILSGAEGPNLSRYLVRLHCEGDLSAEASPGKISLDDAQGSVNAWVARTGKPVYLRKLESCDEPGRFISEDLRYYDDLESVTIYRDGVECELCIPIFAESRLVGTVNLEADRTYAFDATAETVEEYAQLIGIALLESRRRIGVETVTEVEGVLDYRHRLEAELSDLSETFRNSTDLTDGLRSTYTAAVEEIRGLVFLKRVAEVDDFPRDVQVADAISAAMNAMKWGTERLEIEQLTVEPWSKETDAVYKAHVDRESARALAFAIAQALHNVRKYGGQGDRLAKRKYSAMLRFGETRLGGKRSLYVAVSSTCREEEFKDLDPQRVFREPIERPDRVSVGAFLAGEALRRCGGSAYLRVTPSAMHNPIVDAEFCVPAAAPLPI